MNRFRLRFSLPTLCLVAALFGALSARGQKVLINEIMFHPGIGKPGEPNYVREDTNQEFIELLNTDSKPVNLTGWRFDRGVSFTFPDVTVAPSQFLVVTGDSDPARFRAAYLASYPAVTNATILGGWTGTLSDSGEQIGLSDANGKRVDLVGYATEGDWGLRREGEPYPGHDSWWRGWEWKSEADGGGKSLELVQAGLPNEFGQNWRASMEPGGTPGGPNSSVVPSSAPLITEVRHRPAVPLSTSRVQITARLVPIPAPGAVVEVFSRADGDANFQGVAMLDDGAHADGVAGDGFYAGELPGRADKTIVEFYVKATVGGVTRTWPGPSDDQGTQGANALYQVDDSTYGGGQPIYRLIVRKSDYDAWTNLMDATSGGRFSDAAMHGTWVAIDGLGTEIRYGVTVRNRGAGTRAAHPHNLHVSIPNDHSWRGVTSLGLNTRTVHSQVAGNVFYSLAGLPNTYGVPVQVRVNGANLAHATPTGDVDGNQFGSYYAFQTYGREWAERHMPSDPDGNVYKAVWYFDGVKLNNNGGDLRYLGEDPVAYRQAYGPDGPPPTTGAYSKHSNVSEDDWTDLISLVKTLDTAPDATYYEQVSQVIDIDEWLRYFAVSSLVGNMETTLATGVGDDYSMFAGKVDRRFKILVHDCDTTLGQGDTGPDYGRSIFKAADMPVLSRFLKHPQIAPRYFAVLKELTETVFAPETANAALDQWLAGWVPDSVIQSMKDFIVRRRAAVLAQIPDALSVSTGLPVSTYPRTTAATIPLTGSADAAETRAVLVGGVRAGWNVSSASWTLDKAPLRPGINRILVQAADGSGAERARTSVDIWYDGGRTTLVAVGVMTSNTVWTAASGPYRVTGVVEVPANVTLLIEPGTTVFFDEGARLRINGGRLDCRGIADQRIRFSRMPGTSARWAGLQFNDNAGETSAIAYTDIEYADAGAQVIGIQNANVSLDHVTVAHMDAQALDIVRSRVTIRNCVFGDVGAHDLLTAEQGVAADSLYLEGNLFGRSSGVHAVIRATQMGRVLLHDNVFAGSGDNILELIDTDAHLEGNLFMRANPGQAGASASGAVLTRRSSAASPAQPPPRLTAVRNSFFENDYGVIVLDGASVEVFNNVFVGNRGAVLFDMPWLAEHAPGAAVYVENSIFWNNAAENESLGSGTFVHLANRLPVGRSELAVNGSCVPALFHGYGLGNREGDPRFVSARTRSALDPGAAAFGCGFEGLGAFSTALVADGVIPDFRLSSDSPARATGLSGIDMGAAIRPGAILTGVPRGLTTATNLTVKVGGLDLATFRYRLIGPGAVTNAWSAELSSDTIELTGLAAGAYQIELAKTPVWPWSNPAEVTSATWQVDSRGGPRVRINEVLAYNVTGVTNAAGARADAIELVNDGFGAVDLSGWSLSKSATRPQFVFPAGTVLAGGAYQVAWADEATNVPGLHLGFHVSRQGDSIYLLDSPANGSRVLDSVTFGPQLPDRSIGRTPSGDWALSAPTLGGPNVIVPVAAPDRVRINEWLASAQGLLLKPFVELLNPSPLPAALGGVGISASPVAPASTILPPLSFIDANGLAVFYLDASATAADQLKLSLPTVAGAISLFAPDNTLQDVVLYGSQMSDRAEGRALDLPGSVGALTAATPGAPNAPLISPKVSVTETTLRLVAATNTWRFNQSGVDLGSEWRSPGYDDSAWQTGQALLYAGANNYPVATNTVLSLTSPIGTRLITYYFRTHFAVNTNLAGAALRASVVVDDGAIVYLNGNRVFSVGMPSDTNVTYATRPTRTVGTSTLEGPFDISGSALRDGDNTLAVEVHQASDSSHDIAFALGLAAAFTSTNGTGAAGRLPVILNEFLASNRTLTNAQGVASDWVEFLNPSVQPVDLSGVSVSDDPDQARKWIFPPGTALSAGERLVLACDPDAPVSATNTGFGLSPTGGAIYLFDAPQGGGALLDAVYYGLQVADLSLGRNAAGQWTLNRPTPGAANVEEPLGDPAFLRINEWMASPSSGPDWFEVFNDGDRPVALGGFYLSDDLTMPGDRPIPALSFIGTGASAYQIFLADGDPLQGCDHANFKLSASGESIGIFTPEADLIDGATFGVQSADVSQGRLPDGDANMVVFPGNATPGTANGQGPLIITDAELSADGFVIRFTAAANTAYVVQYSESLARGTWLRLSDVPAQTPGGVVTIRDGEALRNQSRYYRVVTVGR